MFKIDSNARVRSVVVAPVDLFEGRASVVFVGRRRRASRSFKSAALRLPGGDDLANWGDYLSPTAGGGRCPIVSTAALLRKCSPRPAKETAAPASSHSAMRSPNFTKASATISISGSSISEQDRLRCLRTVRSTRELVGAAVLQLNRAQEKK